MTIIDIVVISLAFSAQGDDVIGDVRFTIEQDAGTRTLTIPSRASTSRRIRPDALLIGEAIRELRRLPEVRSGEVRLRFAKGLTPFQDQTRVA
ncbi:MAG: hypothetical protein AAFR50_05920 [Pseudomonadota bacterium]